MVVSFELLNLEFCLKCHYKNMCGECTGIQLPASPRRVWTYGSLCALASVCVAALCSSGAGAVACVPLLFFESPACVLGVVFALSLFYCFRLRLQK